MSNGTGSEETFSPTSGRVTGVILVVLAIGTAVDGIVSSSSVVAPWGVCLALLVAVLGWAALLRPRVKVDATAITLRNMYETVTVPLVLVESVVVRQVLVVRADDRRFLNPAASRGRRELRRADRGGPVNVGRTGLGLDSRLLGRSHQGDLGDGDIAYAQHVEDSLRRRVTEAKRAAPRDAAAGAGGVGGTAESEETAVRVVRRPAWGEIGLSVALAVATVVAFVL